MAEQKSFRVLFLAGENGRFGSPLQNYLKNCRTIDFETRPVSRPGVDLNHFQVIILANPAGLSPEEQNRLLD
ncbi:MAG TPA: hypothetical protein DCY27_10430, partial [Desulfobacterales bacterium]|nr:hypothetical protein [Desulfobacterales bacterium]